MIRHVVLFKFRDPTPPGDLAAADTSFMALKGKIEEILDLEHGVNTSPEGLDKGFTHCYLLSFRNESDRDSYLIHPAHKAFSSQVRPILQDVLVVDYRV
jgi:hypothetical protein